MPFTIYWILVLLTAFFYRQRRKKLFHVLAVLSVLWLLLISTPFIPEAMVANLENQYPVFLPVNQAEGTAGESFKSPGSNVHILVLGGGHTNDKRLPANNQLSEQALVRLSEGIRIRRQLPGSTLITSGYSGKSEKAQAEVLANTALLLGVDSSAIKMQTQPKNTWAEANEYKRLFGDKAQLVLVTSAAHMPRAMYLFQKAGLNPIAAPTNHLVKKGQQKKDFWYWLPSSGNIKRMESAIHEYVGLLWYKLGGE